MQSRTALAAGASALLYLGPLLAGLSGWGWVAVPVFIALFALWLVVMRPGHWPRDLSVWTGDIAVAAAAQVAVNALIVIGLFAVGRGIGGVAGFLPNIPPLMPVALSFLAIPLSRWATPRADLPDPGPGGALLRIDEGHSPLSSDEMVAVLLSLPSDSDPMLTADAVDAAMKGPKANARAQELGAVMGPASNGAGTDHRALREAVILWATDLARHPSEGLHNAQAVAFAVAGADPVMLQLFAHRASALLASQPDLWTAFPQPDEVAATVEAAQPAILQETLTALSLALAAAGAGEKA